LGIIGQAEPFVQWKFHKTPAGARKGGGVSVRLLFLLQKFRPSL
jgi:hypothetical protein